MSKISSQLKSIWHKANSIDPLKVFAKLLIKTGQQSAANEVAKQEASIAKEWLVNKKGAKNVKRQEHNLKRIAEEKQASKNPRKEK